MHRKVAGSRLKCKENNDNILSIWEVIIVSVSIDAIMKLPVMKGSVMLTRTGGRNAVDNLTIVEAQDIHFPNYTQGIFVLTTLSAYWDSLEKINALVEGLCKVKVAAIGVKLGRFLDSIDPSTVAIAQQYQVALITLPPTVFFRDVISEVLSCVAGDQRVLLNQINSLNQELFSSIMNNRSIRELLELLGSKLKCYCCCYLPSMEKVAEASSTDRPVETERLREEAARFFENENHHLGGTVGDDLYLYPCIVQDRLLAVVCLQANEAEPELIQSLTQAVANGVSIKLLERDIEDQAARGVVASLLDDILFSTRTDPEVAAERLATLNFTTYRNFMLCVLTSPYIYQDLNWPHIVSNILGVFSQRFKSTLAFKRGPECVVFLSFDADIPDQRLRKIMESCLVSLENIEHHSFTMGCSLVTQELAAVSEHYRQAKKALRFGEIMSRNRNVFMFQDYYDLGLISYGLNSNEARLFREKIIDPVLEFDDQTNSNLWQTLQVSCTEKTLGQAADTLHIHISTLRYRLQKIEQITGYNFFDQADRIKLHLAYILQKISEKEEE